MSARTDQAPMNSRALVVLLTLSTLCLVGLLTNGLPWETQPAAGVQMASRSRAAGLLQALVAREPADSRVVPR